MDNETKMMIRKLCNSIWLAFVCILIAALGTFAGCMYSSYIEQNRQIEQLNAKITELNQSNNELNEYIAKLEDEIAEKERLVQTNVQMANEYKRRYESVPVIVNSIRLLSLNNAPKEPEEIDVSKSTTTTGFTEDDFNELIEIIADHRDIDNCIFSGTGNSFVEVEERYGINGLYLLAIFTNESGFGEKNIRTNNAAGIKIGGEYTSFDSINDCILYLGKLLKTYDEKYKRDTFSEIGDRYCPGNQDWIDDNTDVCNLYAEFAYKNIYEST